MKTAIRKGVLVGCCLMLLSANCLWAQDWPQWRGPNRDARATGFTAPTAWPKALTQKWKVTVGEGLATPALVGDKLYVFSRQDGKEIVRCLAAASGKELWQDKYESGDVTGIAAGRSGEFAGPRSSPTVAEGKVVTLGARGVLSCLDAASGKLAWRKETQGRPKFYISSSPMIAAGLCIAQVGGDSDGALVAYDLATGKEKWKWSGPSPAYASPVLLSLGDSKAVIAETEQNIVAISLADGKLLWKTPFAAGGRRSYNAATPMVDGETLIYSGGGRGTKAVKIEKKGDEWEAKELWSNRETAVQFSTPVVKNGLVFGLSSSNSLFCIDKEGKTAWTSPVGGGGGGGGQGGYGAIVDAGPVLLALTPSAQLIVFQPSDKKFEQVASYKVADKATYGYPIIAGNRVFVKDKDSLYLWTIE